MKSSNVFSFFDFVDLLEKSPESITIGKTICLEDSDFSILLDQKHKIPKNVMKIINRAILLRKTPLYKQML
jgi:hypothetical protein